jgi:hypothetical protein
MWQTLAQIAIPIALDQGVKYLTRNNNSQSTVSNPSQGGWTSNTVGINPDYKTGSSQYIDSLSPEQRQALYRAINDSGTTPQTQSGYSTINNPNLPINSQNVPNQKPGVYNDLLRPIVKETGNQLGKEAVGYFATGETGPLLDLLGKGATYLTALL